MGPGDLWLKPRRISPAQWIHGISGSAAGRHHLPPAVDTTHHLHHRAPGWCWEVQSVQEVGGAVLITGRRILSNADGDLLHDSAVVSEPLESASKAPAAEEAAASACLRRAAALAGLGLELWG